MFDVAAARVPGRGELHARTLRRHIRLRAVHTLTISTERQSQLVDITRLVEEAVVGESGSGVLVYVPHTTAGVTINEHADPMVARDFESALERIVPADWPWQHVEEGEENAPTHIRAAFMGPSVLIPLRDDGSLALGTWQDLLLRVRRATHAIGARVRARLSLSGRRAGRAARSRRPRRRRRSRRVATSVRHRRLRGAGRSPRSGRTAMPSGSARARRRARRAS